MLAALALQPAGLAPARAATLSCPQSLLFGQFTTCNSAETATVTPLNTRNLTGCLSAGGSPFNRAQCNVSQSFPVTNVVISVTGTKYNVTNTTGAKMQVDKFSCRFQGSAKTTTGACNFSTTGFFLVMDIGATLNVGNPQAGGSYSGSFTVNTNFP